MKNVRLLISEFFRIIAFACQILYAVWRASPIDKARLKIASSRAPVSLCFHEENHIYFDKDPIDPDVQWNKNIKKGTPQAAFEARFAHLDFKFCYCSKCHTKYLLYVHYSTPIVSLMKEGDLFLPELDRKLVFPLRTKKLKKLLDGLD